MADNWTFVAAAYVLTAVVLALYWRSLARREREAAPRRAVSRPSRDRTRVSSSPSRADAAPTPTPRG